MLTDRRHIPELDGLRGLAVLLVIVFHSMHVPKITTNFLDVSMHSLFMMGWCGVDIFFTLSGFLITTILLSTKNEKNYFSSFYYKRVLRIFPLYYLYLLFIFLIFFPEVHSKVFGQDKFKLELAQHSQLWFWLYISNIKQFILGRNFGAGVGHLWSLAIEEQFYLVWPCLVYFCSLKRLKTLSLILIIFSLVLRVVFYFNNVSPESIYTFTLTRFDTLLFGAYVAILLKDNYSFNQKKAHLLLLLLLVLCGPLFIIFGPRYESTPVMYTIGYSIIGLTVATLIIILQSGQPSFVNRMFKKKWLIFFGKYSYALYLFHVLIRQSIYRVFNQPKLFFGLQIFWDIFVLVIVIACSTLVALISWHCYEKWFLKLKVRFEKKEIPESQVTV
jgi:peptidoglycan/LPS O-acetylase OafA/YrhL